MSKIREMLDWALPTVAVLTLLIGLIVVPVMALINGCTPPLSAEAADQRQDCLDKAEDDSDEEADKMCDAIDWDDCSYREAIMFRLEKAQRECSRKAHNAS